MNWGKSMLLPVLTAGMALSVYSQSAETKSIKIEEIDKNFQPATVGSKDVCYYDALLNPFVLSGFPWRDPQKVFNRLPSAFTDKDVNPGALS